MWVKAKTRLFESGAIQEEGQCFEVPDGVISPNYIPLSKAQVKKLGLLSPDSDEDPAPPDQSQTDAAITDAAAAINTAIEQGATPSDQTVI